MLDNLDFVKWMYYLEGLMEAVFWEASLSMTIFLQQIFE